MSKIDIFHAYKSAIKALRALPLTIPVITSMPGIRVWIRRNDPVLSYNDVSCRNGRTIKIGSIEIDLLICFEAKGHETTININPLVNQAGRVDINYFRSEYLRIIDSDTFPKELKAHLNGAPRHFHDIFNAYMSVTRMIVEVVNFDCPFQQDTHYAHA